MLIQPQWLTLSNVAHVEKFLDDYQVYQKLEEARPQTKQPQ